QNLATYFNRKALFGNLTEVKHIFIIPDIVSACNDPDGVWLKSINSDKQKNIVAHNVLEQPIELEKPDNDVLPKIIKSVANDKQVFACSACNFKTEKMWTAYRHKHTHSKRYVCHNCGKW
ncbi:unnamed protein product, partial [Owenia fusiformis]